LQQPARQDGRNAQRHLDLLRSSTGSIAAHDAAATEAL